MNYKYLTFRITEIIHSLNDGLFVISGEEAAKLICEAADIIRDYKLGNNYQFIAEHLYSKSDEIRKASSLQEVHDIAVPSRIIIQDYFQKL